VDGPPTGLRGLAATAAAKSLDHEWYSPFFGQRSERIDASRAKPFEGVGGGEAADRERIAEKALASDRASVHSEADSAASLAAGETAGGRIASGLGHIGMMCAEIDASAKTRPPRRG
jgi:hypothetical protein